jgi:hypothetical protein
MLKLEITLENGYFLINGKKYVDCNDQEKEFFSKFLQQNPELIKKLLTQKTK